MAIKMATVFLCAVLLAAVPQIRAGPCQTANAVKCVDCDEECPKDISPMDNFDCFLNCDDGTRPPEDCLDRADRIAEVVAGQACEEAKLECEFPITFAAATTSRAQKQSVSLKDCCLVILQGCKAKAQNIGCPTNGQFGSCTADEFNDIFLDKLEPACQNFVCNNVECAPEIGDHPLCL